MKEYLKKLTASNLFLKIISLVLAIFCWIYIVFITNPEIEIKIADIPITLSNHQSIKNEGYIVSNEITSTVDIKVKGTRKMLANLNRDSIIAYVDLSECTKEKTYNLPVNIKLPYEEISLLSSSILKIPVAVDEYITKEVPVELEGLSDGGYYIYSEQENFIPTVRFSGPEPIVNAVETAVVTIGKNEGSNNITVVQPVKLLNSNGSEIISKTIDVEDKDFVFYQKKDVPVKLNFEDSSDEYECNVTTKTIKIEGPASIVHSIGEIETEIFDRRVINSEGRGEVELIIPDNITVEKGRTTVRVFVTKK